MPLYMIEREFGEELALDGDLVDAIAGVNEATGNTWLFSFLSADKKKTYCLYEASDPEAIRAAAAKLNIPADKIVELGSELHPLGELQRQIRPDVFA